MEPEAPITLATVIKDYGPPVAWILALFGLLYNNKAANEREKRKEFRSEIEAIEKISKEALTKLNSYFKRTTRDDEAKTLEVDIKVLFREIGLKWDRLKKRQSGGTLGLYIDPCSEALDAFYAEATDKYFETEKRPLEHDRQIHAHQIHVSCLLFIEALHALFLMKFDNIRKE